MSTTTVHHVSGRLGPDRVRPPFWLNQLGLAIRVEENEYIPEGWPPSPPAHNPNMLRRTRAHSATKTATSPMPPATKTSLYTPVLPTERLQSCPSMDNNLTPSPSPPTHLPSQSCMLNTSVQPFTQHVCPIPHPMRLQPSPSLVHSLTPSPNTQPPCSLCPSRHQC